MLNINGNKYAANDTEFVSSLFNGPKTCSGFYRRKGKNKIIFLDLQRRPFAALVRNKHGIHLVNYTEKEGKGFYQFGLAECYESIFGLAGLGYLAKIDAIKSIGVELLC